MYFCILPISSTSLSEYHLYKFMLYLNTIFIIPMLIIYLIHVAFLFNFMSSTYSSISI